MSPQFSADDIDLLIRRSDLDTLARRAADRFPPCNYCGKHHVLDFGGESYCQSPHHFAHGPGWSAPSEPMGDEEKAELLAEIKAKKDATYPGGYQKWCDDRGIPEEKR